MVDIECQYLEQILEQPLNVNRLIKVSSEINSATFPQSLKISIILLNKCLSDWRQCSNQIAILKNQLNDAEEKGILAKRQMVQCQSQLDKLTGLDNLDELLLQAQKILQLQNELQQPRLIHTWQQKKAYFEAAKLALLKHLKVIAKNTIVKQFHQLPAIIVDLLTYGIHINRNTSLEQVYKLIFIHKSKLIGHKQRLQNLEDLSKIVELHEAYLQVVSKINGLKQHAKTNSEAINLIEVELETLEPIINQEKNLVIQNDNQALEQESECCCLPVETQQYVKGLFLTGLASLNLVDESTKKYLEVSASTSKYNSLTKKKDILEAQNKKNRQLISQYRSQLNQFKQNFKLMGVNQYSSYDMTQLIKSKLQAIDPEVDYANLDKTQLNQRIKHLVKTLPRKIDAINTIIPLLQSFKEELSQIRGLRKHHQINATIEELTQNYPWKSPQTLTLQETTSRLNAISNAIKKIDRLCKYERDLNPIKASLQRSQQSKKTLQQALTEKENQLLTIEKSVNEAIDANRIAINEAKKNDMAKTDNQPNKQQTSRPTANNLWRDYLNPLIVSQAKDLKSWLLNCCQFNKKQSLSGKEKLQFEQLCRDIYTELKYGNGENNTVLLAYKELFNQPKGLKKLLRLKPAISIDSQRRLPTLKNKQLHQTLQQFKLIAKTEKGKIADIIEQTYSQLHYLAWQGEKKGLNTKRIEALKQRFIDDPRYQCLQQSKRYESILDWLNGIVQIIKQLYANPISPMYHYGLFSKKTAYLDTVTKLCEKIAVCA